MAARKLALIDDARAEEKAFQICALGFVVNAPALRGVATYP